MAAEKGNSYYLLGLDKTGRKPIYSDPEELRQRCVEYFESTENYTITGLALYLGFSSRGTLNEYAKKDNFSDIVKRAMLVVEQGYEEMFHNGSNAGVFPLKNMGWSDKTEVSQTNINHNSTPLTKEEIEAETKKRNELLDNY